MTHLDVPSGETYTVDAGDVEEWSRADIDGTLEVQGTLKLIDNPDTPGDPTVLPDESPVDLPLGIDLPMASLNISMVSSGLALFLMGILALLGAAGAVMRNYAALIMWGFALIGLVLSGTLGIGLELFWALVVATILLLIVGSLVRWIGQ